MNPIYSLDARKALWTGTRVQLHIACRKTGTAALVPWLKNYGEDTRPLTSNYIHRYWLDNRDGDTIRTYVGILKEWAGLSN